MGTVRRSLKADDFRREIAKCGKVEVARVTGDVRLRSIGEADESNSPGEAAYSGFSVRDVVFEGEFLADSLHFLGALHFEDCNFEKGFSARNVRADAGFSLTNCRFWAPEESSAICLDGIHVDGTLDFRFNLVYGHLMTRRMHITGDALFNGLKACERGSQIPDSERFYKEWPLALSGADTPILNLRGSIIDGTLNLGGLGEEHKVEEGNPDKDVDADEWPWLTVIAGNADAVGIQIGHKLQLWSMRIAGKLDLSNAKVAQDILAQTLVRPGPDGQPRACGLHVDDLLRLVRADVKGDLNCNGALIGGDLVCSLSKISGVFSGNPAHITADRWCNLVVDGRLRLSASEIGFLALRSAQIGSDVEAVTGTFHRIYIGPHLRPIGNAPSRRDHGASSTRQEENTAQFRLAYEPSRARSIEIRSVAVGENLIIAGVQLGREASPTASEPAAFATGSLLLNECTVGGRLALGIDGITEETIEAINRHPDAARNLYRPILGDHKAIRREAIENSDRLLPIPKQTGNDLSSCREAWFKLDAEYPAKIDGVLDLARNSIGGELDLSNVQVRGEIQLQDTVSGDLRASRFGLGRHHREGEYPLYLTKCSRFDMHNLHCKGDADLTGLFLKEGIEQNVHGPYASITGDLLFWSKHDQPKEQRSSNEELHGADLCPGGRIDLTAAQIGRLVISGLNFVESADDDVSTLRRLWRRLRLWWSGENTNQTQGKSLHGGLATSQGDASGTEVGSMPCLNLEHAKLGRLEIKRPIPASIQLSGIRVVKWDLSPDETYVSVLRSTDRYFSGDVYTQMQNSLHNDGKNKLADRVQRLMRKRLEKEMRKNMEFVRLVLSCIHRILTRYGTSALLPLGYILVIVMLNALLLASPHNIVASTAYLETIPEDDIHKAVARRKAETERQQANWPVVADLSPMSLGHDWSVGDVMAITARFSVPLITLAMSDRWEPARHDAVVPCPTWARHRSGDEYCSLPARVATITRLLGYLSWIFWPLFILRVSSVIGRRELS